MIRNIVQLFKRAKPGNDYWLVNIYAKNDGRLIFIPTGESKGKLITELDSSIELIPPFSAIDVKSMLTKAIDLCFSYRPEVVSYRNNIEKSNASRAYEKKVIGHKLVSVFWNNKDGFRIEPHRKASSRGFQVIESKVIVLKKSSDMSDVSKAILTAFAESQAY